MKRIDTTIAEGASTRSTPLTSGASASSPTRSTTSPMVTTPSSTSTQIPAQIAELDRVLRITDAVVRHMIVRRDDQE